MPNDSIERKAKERGYKSRQVVCERSVQLTTETFFDIFDSTAYYSSLTRDLRVLITNTVHLLPEQSTIELRVIQREYDNETAHIDGLKETWSDLNSLLDKVRRRLSRTPHSLKLSAFEHRSLEQLPSHLINAMIVLETGYLTHLSEDTPDSFDIQERSHTVFQLKEALIQAVKLIDQCCTRALNKKVSVPGITPELANLYNNYFSGEIAVKNASKKTKKTRRSQ